MDNDMNLVISNQSIKFPFLVKLIFLCLFILSIFMLNYKISLYDIYEAKIIRMEDNYYVQVYIPMNKQTFLHNEDILIDNKKYKYKINNINKEYLSYQNNIYMVVNLIVDLDKSYNIENNYLKIKQETKKESLFNILLNKLKKGMSL